MEIIHNRRFVTSKKTFRKILNFMSDYSSLSIMENYKLTSHFIPAVNKGMGDSKKIMLTLHGLGDSLESYKVFAKEINVTGLNYLLLNGPKRYYFGYSWYDIPPQNPHLGICENVKIISEVIEQLNKNGHEYSDIILCGFSQGGCMVLETLYQLPHKIAGAICMSPRIYPDRIMEAKDINKSTPVLIAHGLFDEVISFQETKSHVENYVMKKFENVEFCEFEMHHEIDAFEILKIRNWLNEII